MKIVDNVWRLTFDEEKRKKKNRQSSRFQTLGMKRKLSCLVAKLLFRCFWSNIVAPPPFSPSSSSISRCPVSTKLSFFRNDNHMTVRNYCPPPPSSLLCFTGIETISSETRSKNPVYLPTFPFYILDLWFLLLLFFFTLKSINKNEQQMRNGRTVGRQLKESLVAIQIQTKFENSPSPPLGF